MTTWPAREGEGRPTGAAPARRPRSLDRHAANAISARVRPDLRAWFDLRVAETGRTLSDLATEALTEYRDNHDQEPTP